MTNPAQPAAEDATHEGGRIFGRYLILDEIASGGMATVHLAHARDAHAQDQADRFVAVKCMHAHYARDPDFVSMFLDEAMLCTQIRHENVVATIDVSQEKDELLLVLELVDGESLSKLVKSLTARRAKVPQAIASAIVCDMLRGLHAAHEAKNEAGEPLMIVHRDVSPHNVLVGTDGVARVLDFGVAKARGRVQQTQKGQLKGKLAYMSPEQARGRTVDRRSDVFSAGIVLWELLTGARLFEGENEAALLVALLSEVPSAPSKKDPALAKLDPLVLKALSVDPDVRFPTALAMAAAVEAEIRPATRAEVAAWVKSEARASLTRRRELIEKARKHVAALGSRQATPPPAAARPPTADLDDGDRDSSPTAIASDVTGPRPSERGAGSAPRMLGGPALPRSAIGPTPPTHAPLPPVRPPTPSNRGTPHQPPKPLQPPTPVQPPTPAPAPPPAPLGAGPVAPAGEATALWETSTTTQDSPQTLALPAEANPFRAPEPAPPPALAQAAALGPTSPPLAAPTAPFAPPAAHHDLTVPLFQAPLLRDGELHIPGLAPPPPIAQPTYASTQPPPTAESIPSQVTSVTLTTTDLPPPLPKEHVRRLTFIAAASAAVGAIAAVAFLVIVTRKPAEGSTASARDAVATRNEASTTATGVPATTAATSVSPSATLEAPAEPAPAETSASASTSASATATAVAAVASSAPKPSGPRPHGFLNRPSYPTTKTTAKPKPTTTSTAKPKR